MIHNDEGHIQSNTSVDIESQVGNPLSAAIMRRDGLVIDMVENAIKKKKAVLSFQPIVCADAFERIQCYEGLMRILDDTGRPIPARDFMSQVEDTETGRKIDCLALDLGVRALAARPNLKLSLNMSARSVGYAKWMDTLKHELASNSDFANRLTIEFSQHSVMLVPDLIAPFMAELQGYGVSFSIDNFGSGAIDFNHLQRLFFDNIKIDGRLCERIAPNPEQQIVVETFVDIARRFDMNVVGTNITNGHDAAFLIHAGVNFLQGFYFGAPSLKMPEHLPDAIGGGDGIDGGDFDQQTHGRRLYEVR